MGQSLPEVRGQDYPLNQHLNVCLLGHREDFEGVKIKPEGQIKKIPITVPKYRL